MRKRYIVFFVITLLCGSVFLFFAETVHAEGGLRVTEIMGANTRSVDDEGNSPDWIEIHNGTSESVDLKGYWLSDKPEKLAKWEFPERIIAPGEYLVVYASGKNKKAKGKELHANFKISDEDRGVYFSDSTQTLIDQVIIEKLPKDISYGEHPETGNWQYFPEPTPGKANTSAAYSPVVKYSVAGGFYDEPFEVRLYAEGVDPRIYYTTDGSTPSFASKVYSGPIRVDKNMTIRAFSLEDGHLPSPPSGQAYFVGFDHKNIAVLAISTEEDALWDPREGLFRDVHYKDYMVRESLRVHVAYFDEYGNMGISQDATIGVVGASSREVMMRPLKLNASEKVDPLNGKFKCRILKKDIEEFRHFQLRNNNQDGVRYLDDEECMPSMGIRNALFCDLCRDLEGIEVRDDNGPILLFLNGKNYGLMNIGEKRDDTGIKENNPEIKSSDVDLVVIRDDMGLRIGRNSLGKGKAFIRHDAKVVYKGYFDDGAVEYEEISEHARRNGNTAAVDDFINLDPTDSKQLDPRGFIASMAAHAIACNSDFGMNNIAFWRESPLGEEPGPFHTYTFDFDSTFGLVMWMEDYDPLLDYEEYTKIFPEFIEKEENRIAFIRKVDEYLNGPFHPDHVLPVIDALENKMEPWIAHHLELWADGKMDKAKWHKNVDHMRNFVKVRPKYMRMNLENFFNFSGYSDLTFTAVPEGSGTIYMDTEVFETPVEGKGKYANIPMKIFASPSRGYKFDHYIINGRVISEEEYTFDPEDGMEIKAVFKEAPLEPVADLCLNEVVRSGEHKILDEDGNRQDWVELYNVTERSIDLDGMYLTDDENKLKKWKFPRVSIGPEEFLVIFLSGKNRRDPKGNLHASFKLSLEPVLLVDDDGETVIDIISLEEMAALPKNSSGIRSPDGSAIFIHTTTSTPGSSNTQGYQ